MEAVDPKTTFLGYFWDLALEDHSRRLTAAELIVQTVKETGAGHENIGYTLKRLIRGISSAREAARQGFATCLCEILALPFIDVNEVLTLLEEHTKITGGLKGSEERDMMFGKLFGLVSVLQSNRFWNDKEVMTKVFDQLMVLMQSKVWFREAVGDAILELLNKAQPKIASGLLSKLEDYFPEAISTYEPWQIMLGLGLEFIAQNRRELNDTIVEMLPMHPMLTVESLGLMKPALLNSTAGYPKIHKVWDYILANIFGFDAENRCLPQSRVNSLSVSQGELLRSLADFMDTEMLVFSHEKRGVALRVVSRMVAVCPRDHLGVALTPGTARCLVKVRRPVKSVGASGSGSAGTNKKNGGGKHILHSLAGSVINDIVSSAMTNPNPSPSSTSNSSESSMLRLTLASVLASHGGANFDALTGSNAVQSLLADLAPKDIETYVLFLCASLSPQALGRLKVTRPPVKKGTSEDGGDQDNDDDEEDEQTLESLVESHVTNTLEALGTLCSNPHLANRDYTVVVTLTVLLRLSTFSLARDQQQGTKGLVSALPSRPTPQGDAASGKTPKKKGDKKKNKKGGDDEGGDVTSGPGSAWDLDPLGFGIPSEVVLSASRALAVVEGREVPPEIQGLLGVSPSSTGAVVPSDVAMYSDAISEAASSRFMALLADSSHLPLGSSASSPSAKGGVSTVFHAVLSLLRHLDQGSASYQLDEALGDMEQGEDGDEVPPMRAREAVVHVTSVVSAMLNRLRVSSSSTPQAGGSSQGGSQTSVDRLVTSFAILTSFVLFHALTSRDVSISVVGDILEAGQHIFGYEIQGLKSQQEPNGDDEDEDNGSQNGTASDRAYVSLFNSCMEVLSIPADHSIKGAKEAIRRLWTALGQLDSSSSQSSGGIEGVSESVLSNIVEAVIGDDVERDMEGDDQEDHDDGGDDEDEIDNDNDNDNHSDLDDNDNDNDSDNNNNNDKKKKSGMKHSKNEDTKQKENNNNNKQNNNKSNNNKNEVNENEDNEDEEEEDIILNEEQLMKLMEDDDALDGTAMLEHSAEADRSLSHLIATQKSLRKAGLLQRKRLEYLVRTRALGILEVLLSRCEDPLVLLGVVLRPLLACSRAVSSQSLVLGLHEGRAFLDKLHVVLDQKVLRGGGKKLSLTEEQAASLDEDALVSLVTHVKRDLMSTSGPMGPQRSLAQAVLLTMCRPSFAMASEAVNGALTSSVRDLLHLYLTRKNHRLTSRLFDELVSRCPDWSLSVTAEELVRGSSQAKTVYLRAECLRLLSEYYRRWRGLSPTSQGVLSQSLEGMVQGVLAFFRPANNNPTSTTTMSAKRARSVLTSVKEVLQSSMTQVTNKPDDMNVVGKVLAAMARVAELPQTLQSAMDRQENNRSQVVERLVEAVVAQVKTMEKWASEQQQQKGKSGVNNNNNSNNNNKNNNNSGKRDRSEMNNNNNSNNNKKMKQENGNDSNNNNNEDNKSKKAKKHHNKGK